MDVLYSAETLGVWHYKVKLDASSHSHYNCNLVRSPEPNQITKLKLPSTSCSLDLGAQEMVSKWFLMSVWKFKTTPCILCFLKHLSMKRGWDPITGDGKIFLYQMMSWLTLFSRSNESVKFICMGCRRKTYGHLQWWRASKAHGLHLAAASLTFGPFTSIYNIY